jgi:hypothetical protein
MSTPNMLPFVFFGMAGNFSVPLTLAFRIQPSAFFPGTAAKRRKRRKINCWETVRQRQPVSAPSVHFCGNLVPAPTLAFLAAPYPAVREKAGEFSLQPCLRRAFNHGLRGLHGFQPFLPRRIPQCGRRRENSAFFFAASRQELRWFKMRD